LPVVVRRPFLHLAALALAAASLLTAVGAAPTLAWDGGSFSTASEQELLGLTNGARSAVGLPALRWDGALASIARWRSEDMIDRDFFSHNIPPTGEMAWDVMDQRGYCYEIAGENIGWNMNWPDDQATVQIENSFIGSDTHRDNILGRAWDSVGIGAFKGADGKVMWTVLFADRCGTTPAASQPASAPKPSTSALDPVTVATTITKSTSTKVVRLRHGSNNVVRVTFALGPLMANMHVQIVRAARGCDPGRGGVRCGSGRSYGGWTDFSVLTTRIADASGNVTVALSTHHAQWLSLAAVIPGDPTGQARTATQQVRWR
jgi:uncharacterized protein YkwD